MSLGYSTARHDDWKYPLPEKPNAEGYLAVSENPSHRIYWHEYGNVNGEPLIFVHGGPGGGSTPADARFFNPRHYRIVLFDQRGCGKSTPNATVDPIEAIKNNTTSYLIQDIELLRAHLKIKAKLTVFGGSWGSTLALAYAIEYPQRVRTLVLRGIFLGRKKDLDYIYQGNAATYHKEPYDTSAAGAYIFYPEAWKEFVEVINTHARRDMINAYRKIFSAPGVDSEVVSRAIMAWSGWEGAASYLAPAPEELTQFLEPLFAQAFARIENHYFANGCFLANSTGSGYLLENAGNLAPIAIHIVQGNYDQVCPRNQADELVAALGGRDKVNYVLTSAGHSANERHTMKELTYIMDHL